VEHERKDEIGKDIAEKLQVEDVVAAFGGQLLDSSVLDHDHYCADYHQSD